VFYNVYYENFSSHTNEFLRECHHPEPEVRGRSKLNDREKRQASIPILVFGIVGKTYVLYLFGEMSDKSR